jgi:hypothetical protein
MLALLPLLLTLAPSLIGAIAGDKAGTVTGQAIAMAKTVTGTDTEAAAASAIAADPAKATELSVALAKIAADARAAQDAQETERLKALLADTANARAATANPLIAKAQVTLAGAIVVMFAGTITSIMLNGMPTDGGNFVLLFGALIAAQQAVISFFFGGSTSAHTANATMALLAQRQPLLALPSPPAIINQPSGPVLTGSTADDLNTASLRAARGG